jgi:hypothetical protein
VPVTGRSNCPILPPIICSKAIANPPPKSFSPRDT